MAVRKVLSKKGKVILVISIITGVLVIGGSGYLLWRINQEEKLSSEDSGAVSCAAGSQCPACEWPDVGYCGCNGDPYPNVCSCRKPGTFSCGTGCGSIDYCTPAECPSGWESCGLSGQEGAEAEGCIAKTSCNTACTGCKNKSVVKRYCKQVNTCEGGGWTAQVPSTVGYGESVQVSGYGKDSDGVNPSSVVIKIDGTSVGNGSAKVDNTDTTKTNWSYKFTNLTVGSHKIEISWKDNKGIGGSNCTLSSTFTVSKQDICDGGGWITEVPEIVEYGESVKVSGYGQDSDGVDPSSVIVTLDSESVNGVETAVDSTDATKTNWSYTITGLEAGNYTLTVSWKDNNGTGGSSCMLTDTFTVSKTTTSWRISKTGTPVCEEGSTDDLDEVQISYVITVTNKGTSEGILDKITDTLDSKVQESFLVPGLMTGGGVFSNGAIIWDLSDAQMTFASGESKLYQYSILIPRSSFGSYSNIVTATVKEGETFSASATVQTSCNLVQTGIFDDATKKIFLGFSFLALGMLYMKFDFVKLAWNGVQDGRKKRFRNREISRVKRVFKSRERFEKEITKDR